MAQITLEIGEVAAALRVSKRTVYRLIANQQLRTVNVASRGRPRLRVAESALDAFIKTRSDEERAA